MSKQKILFDANAIIKLHQFSLWNQVIHICHAVVTPIIRRESKFYKNEFGQKMEINLCAEIDSKKIEEIQVPLEMFNSISEVLRDSFLEGIDAGEREAIALLYATRQKNAYRFCTLDRLAIKCLGVLGLGVQGISIEEILLAHKLKSKLLNENLKSCSKEAFKRMLSEGFEETKLHRKY
jgi:hypothetical protein